MPSGTSDTQEARWGGPRPCTCKCCTEGFYTEIAQRDHEHLRYSYILSPDGAPKFILQFVDQAAAWQYHICKRLGLHADLLMSRWRKRSREKRRQLLLEITPTLEEKQWIIPRVYYDKMEARQAGRPLKKLSEQVRQHLLLPWLNIEALAANPSLLFALLHYRTQHPLWEWSAFDSRQLHYNWQMGDHEVGWAKKCVIMYGPGYGLVVDWESTQAHTCYTLGYPRAQLVFTAQALLFTILARIVDAILSGVDDSTTEPRTEKWRVQTKKGFRLPEEVERWSPYTFSAFSKPPRLDVDYLVSLAKSRRQEALDHLTDLQCDPMYLRRYIKLALGTPMLDREELAYVLSTDVLVDINSYLAWLWLEEECLKVQALHARYADSIYHGKPLPSKYDKALGSLEVLLTILVNSSMEDIARRHQLAPGFSHNFMRVSVSGPEVGRPAYASGPREDWDSREAFESDPLNWCISRMATPPFTPETFDHAMLFSMFQSELSQATRKEAARVDEMLLRTISNHSAVHEMSMAVELNRPKNTARDLDEIPLSEFDSAINFMKFMHGHAKQKHLDPKLWSAGRLLDKQFYSVQPPTGPKNEAWLRKARSLRSAVDAFWKLMAEVLKMKLTLHSTIKDDQEAMQRILDIANPSLRPEYAAAVAREEAQVMEYAKRRSAPAPDVFNNRDAQPESLGLETLTIREPKVKTRPDRAGEVDEAARETEETEEAPVVPEPAKIAVSERTLRLVRLMYPATGDHEGKDVLWDEVVHAMVDAGFVASNNGGSAVRFEIGAGVNGADGGSIIFHKPHPVPKVDPIMLRSLGRRMTKWFDWSRDRFVAK